jgi:hypothetical protein
MFPSYKQYATAWVILYTHASEQGHSLALLLMMTEADPDASTETVLDHISYI